MHCGGASGTLRPSTAGVSYLSVASDGAALPAARCGSRRWHGDGSMSRRGGYGQSRAGYCVCVCFARIAWNTRAGLDGLQDMRGLGPFASDGWMTMQLTKPFPFPTIRARARAGSLARAPRRAPTPCAPAADLMSRPVAIPNGHDATECTQHATQTSSPVPCSLCALPELRRQRARARLSCSARRLGQPQRGLSALRPDWRPPLGGDDGQEELFFRPVPCCFCLGKGCTRTCPPAPRRQRAL